MLINRLNSQEIELVYTVNENIKSIKDSILNNNQSILDLIKNQKISGSAILAIELDYIQQNLQSHKQQKTLNNIFEKFGKNTILTCLYELISSHKIEFARQIIRNLNMDEEYKNILFNGLLIVVSIMQKNHNELNRSEICLIKEIIQKDIAPENTINTYNGDKINIVLPLLRKNLNFSIDNNNYNYHIGDTISVVSINCLKFLFKNNEILEEIVKHKMIEEEAKKQLLMTIIQNKNNKNLYKNNKKAYQNTKKLLTLLIKNLTNLNFLSKSIFSNNESSSIAPLSLAISLKDYDTVVDLIENGADVNYSEGNDNESIPIAFILTLDDQLNQEVKENLIKIVMKLIKHGAKIDNTCIFDMPNVISTLQKLGFDYTVLDYIIDDLQKIDDKMQQFEKNLNYNKHKNVPEYIINNFENSKNFYNGYKNYKYQLQQNLYEEIEKPNIPISNQTIKEYNSENNNVNNSSTYYRDFVKTQKENKDKEQSIDSIDNVD